MHYIQCQLANYKGFLDSGPITLKPGFNIFTGQNDAGKTALLEALSLEFKHKPHKSLLSTASRDSTARKSLFVFKVALSRQDLQDFFLRQEGLWIPRSTIVAHSNNHGLVSEAIERLLEQPETSVEITLSNGRLLSFQIPDLITPNTPLNQQQDCFERNKNGRYVYRGASSSSSEHGIGEKLTQHIRHHIYAFRAERFKIGRFAFGDRNTLSSDAANLPEVLNTLQANPVRFRRLTELARRVFSHVQNITLPPISSTEVEVRLWTDDPALERDDLAVPLSESGTGVGQVLAMLYILVTATFPRIIIIDEPNSFLNPGAVRSLVEIFREHSQHQYIVTTHSPEFITAADPSTVHILRRHKTVEQVDARETKHLRNILSEVGSRLSDVFGADNILWVEGPTEEHCFPLIVRKLLNRPLGRTAIVGVINTGDFDRANPKLIMRLYERLSKGPALLPPAIGFIFDRELRSDNDREDLKRESKQRIAFLARRTYENYLLHATAIAEVLNEQFPAQDKTVTTEDVQAWLDQHKADSKYFGKAKERDFLQDIDAPRFLSDLFFELSGQTLEYSKMEHSVRLTEWLLEHDAKAFDEIAKLIGEKLPSALG